MGRPLLGHARIETVRIYTLPTEDAARSPSAASPSATELVASTPDPPASARRANRSPPGRIGSGRETGVPGDRWLLPEDGPGVRNVPGGSPPDPRGVACLSPGGSPVPRHSQPESPWWPEPSTPRGAVLYAVLGGLVVWLLVNVLPHVHIYISWR